MKKFIIAAALAASLAGMTSCTGLLMSSDFGLGDYGPVDDYYWPNYGNIYNPPLGYYGPAWGAPTPPPPPPGGGQPQRPNGANRPNYAPSQPSQGSSQRPVITTTPTGQQRPGNMGQGTVQPAQNNSNNSGSSGTHRGR